MKQRTNMVTISEVAGIDRIEIRPKPLGDEDQYIEINVYLPEHAGSAEGGSVLSFDRGGFRDFRNAIVQVSDTARALAREIGEDD